MANGEKDVHIALVVVYYIPIAHSVNHSETAEIEGGMFRETLLVVTSDSEIPTVDHRQLLSIKTFTFGDGSYTMLSLILVIAQIIGSMLEVIPFQCRGTGAHSLHLYHDFDGHSTHLCSKYPIAITTNHTGPSGKQPHSASYSEHDPRESTQIQYDQPNIKHQNQMA